MQNPYNILIALCVLVVISYLFNIISSRIKIPSVILLLSTGIGLNYIGQGLGYHYEKTQFLLELLGIVGLILIVLEGSLELHLSRKKVPLVLKSIVSAAIILVATSAIIALILVEFLDMQVKNAIIYAVPLGVISSAIAIPSVEELSTEKKEFIIYESTFSDIMGIMLFNYVIVDNVLSAESLGNFLVGFVLIIIISLISSLLLLFLLNYTTSHAKFFLIFAVLILIYSLAKMMHLPSLLLILVFGLMLNNARLYIRGPLMNYLYLDKVMVINEDLKVVTTESAFLIRTFFFLLFGYSIDLTTLYDIEVVFIGSLIIGTILFTRFIFLRFISKTNVIPEIFIAPRGLITIILFYSIPVAYYSSRFSQGILFFVIIVSALIMMLGLMLSKGKYDDILQDLDTGSNIN